MNDMTTKESLIFAVIVNVAQTEYCSSVKEVAKLSGMKIPIVKGVVGSLVKKGYVHAETDERNGIVFKDLFPMFEGEFFCYGGESLSNHGWAAYNAYIGHGGMCND